MERLLFAVALVACTALMSQADAAQASSAIETQKTAAAVIAVDQHWLEAEVHGDVGWLDKMLLPEYRSVGAGGSTSSKEKILQSARRNGRSDAMARYVQQYLKRHPSAAKVTLRGDTAILNFYAQKLGLQNGITSCDIFMYIDGRWHAIYSQHTSVKA